MNKVSHSLTLIYCTQVKGKWVIKSGTDFREYSEIRVTLGGKADGVTIKKHIVDSSVAEDPDVKAVVSKYLGETTYHKPQSVSIL